MSAVRLRIAGSTDMARRPLNLSETSHGISTRRTCTPLPRCQSMQPLMFLFGTEKYTGKVNGLSCGAKDQLVGVQVCSAKRIITPGP
jgi:hypothetical protein